MRAQSFAMLALEVPDAAVRVEADAVGADPVGPDATVGQGAVVGDAEGGEEGHHAVGHSVNDGRVEEHRHREPTNT
jgi:hypothetical protein